MHPDLLTSSLKRHASANTSPTTTDTGKFGSFYPECAFKVVLVYASYMHTKAAAAKRALKTGKQPPKIPSISWIKGLVKVQAALNIRQSKTYGFTRFSTAGVESDYFDDNVDFVIIDNQVRGSGVRA